MQLAPSLGAAAAQANSPISQEYSISSSPLADPTKASLTFSVLKVPSRATPSRPHLGVASNYLAHLRPFDTVHIAVKKSLKFYLPADPAHTAVVMVCAGTGIAPFHGFLAERAAQKAAGRELAPAYLFYGCQHPDQDALFRDELAAWEGAGVVSVFWAHSHATGQSAGCAHVQDRLWAERATLARAFGEENAKVYVCGSNAVGQGVTDAAKRAYREYYEGKGATKSDAEVDAWFEKIKNVRYVSALFT